MQIIPHSFNRYDMSAEEAKSGHLLTLSNKAVIQNLIAEKAEAKLSLQLDPLNINLYIQEEAYLKGQIEILNYLVNMADFAAEQPNQSGD